MYNFNTVKVSQCFYLLVFTQTNYKYIETPSIFSVLHQLVYEDDKSLAEVKIKNTPYSSLIHHPIREG